MITEDAPASSSAAPATSISLCSPWSLPSPEGASMPKPPMMTEKNERFMALHMM